MKTKTSRVSRSRFPGIPAALLAAGAFVLASPQAPAQNSQDPFVYNTSTTAASTFIVPATHDWFRIAPGVILRTTAGNGMAISTARTEPRLYIWNSGTLIGATNGVYLGMDFVITNDEHSLIQGVASHGIGSSSGPAVLTEVINSGTITGALSGIHYNGATGLLVVTNSASGVIISNATAGADSGVYNQRAASLGAIVDNAGLVSGMNSGVYLASSGTVINRDTGLIISENTTTSHAAIMFLHASFACLAENSGTLIGGARGILFNSASGTNILVNHAGGLIETQITGDANYAAVFAGNNIALNVDNAGEIRGASYGLRLGGASTIVNTGTITGGDGAAIAFLGTAATATSSLTLGNGSLVIGDIVSAAAGLNHITLKDSGSINSNITGVSGVAANSFSTLTMDGADWTLSGAVQLSGATADTLNVAAGRLTLTGETIFANAAGSATIAAGGTLQIGNNTSTAGFITTALSGLPAIINNGAFAIGSADDIVLTGALPLTGAGSFIKDGSGSLDITAATLGSTGGIQVQDGKLIAIVSQLTGDTLLGASTAVLEINQAADAIHAGLITGAGSLIKEGAGLLTLSNAANNYTGATTVNSGTLFGHIGQGTLTVETGATYKVADGVTDFTISGVLGAGTIDLNASSLSFNVAAGVSDTFAFTGVLTSSNPASLLRKTGAGTLVLVSNANLGGGAAIQEGTLRLADQTLINAPVALGTGSTHGLIEYTDTSTPWEHAITLNGSPGSATLSGGGFSVAAGTQTLTASATIAGAGTFIKDGAGTLDITAATMNNTGNTAVLDGKLITDISRLKGDTILGATTAVLEINQAADAIYAGSITGTGSLIKEGAGLLTLSNAANNYTGATTVHSGTVFGHIGQGTLTVEAGATYKVADGVTDFSISGVLGAGTIDLNASSLGFYVAAGVTDTFDFSGVLISSNTNSALTKTGAGTLVLMSNANLGGGAAIQEGTLRLADQTLVNAPVALGAATTQGFLNYIGASAWAHNIVLTGQGGGFAVEGGATTILGAATISGAGDFVKAGAGTLDITAATMNNTGNTTVLDGRLITDVSRLKGSATLGAPTAVLEINQAADATHAGIITGSGKLAKTGAGTLTLSGNGHTHTGGTEILAGSLAGTTTSLTGDFAIAAAASLILDQNTDGVFSGIVSGAGLIEKSSSGKVTLTGAYTDTPAVKVNDGTLQGSADNLRGNIELAAPGATIVFEHSGTVAADYAGIISGAGNFEKIGVGTLTFTQAQTYTGATRITAGTLRTAADNRLPLNSTVILAGGMLDLGTTSQQIQNLTGGEGVLALTADYNPDTELLPKVGKLNVSGSATGAIKLLVTFNNSTAAGGATGAQVLDIAGDNAATYDVTYLDRAVVGAYDIRFNPASGVLGLTLLSPEVLGAATLPALAQLMGKAGVDSLHQRLGDLRHQRTSEPAYTLRGIYREDELQGDEFGGFKVRTTGVQAGVSWAIEDAIDPKKGRLDIGFLATAVQAEASKTIAAVDANAREIGCFTTFQRGAWHADLLANFAYNKYEINLRDGSKKMRHDGWGSSVALETGWHFYLGKYSVIEPQAQVVWQYHQLHRGKDSFERNYTFDSTDSLITRAALRWHAEFKRKGGVFAVVPYALASVGKEYRAKYKIMVANTSSSTPFENDLGGSEATFECGLTVRLAKNFVLYGNAAWTDGSAVKSTYATTGLRLCW